MAAAKLVLLAVVIVSGTAAIIWLRTLGEAFGINWIDDQAVVAPRGRVGPSYRKAN